MPRSSEFPDEPLTVATDPSHAYRWARTQVERARIATAALRHHLDQVEQRGIIVANLLQQARGWFTPYLPDTKRCQFCQSEMGATHEMGCAYRRWEDEVTRFLGPLG